MATPDWTDVPDTSLEPGDPIRSIDIIAIKDHAEAMAGGATGAPKIKLMALEAIATGTTIRSRNDTEIIGYEPYDLHSFAFTQIGTINVYAEHKTDSASYPSTLNFIRRRNGSDTTVNTWATTSTAYVARNADISVLPGDVITIQKTGGVAIAADTYGKNARFRTDGGNLWPGAEVRLENDYTVV